MVRGGWRVYRRRELIIVIGLFKRKDREGVEIRGRVMTPFSIALYMVNKLFGGDMPTPTSRVLGAGCGSGAFIKAILTSCKQRHVELPEIVGVEIDLQLADQTRRKFKGIDKVSIIDGDFLILREQEVGGKFDYVISNSTICFI